MCVGNFRSIARHWSTMAVPIDHHFSPFAASSVKDDGKHGGGARHEVQLLTRVLRCCMLPGFEGNLSRLRALQRRETHRRGSKRHVLSIDR